MSLNSSRDIIADSTHLIQGNVSTHILDSITVDSVDTAAVIIALVADQAFLNAIAAGTTDSHTKPQFDNVFYNVTTFTAPPPPC